MEAAMGAVERAEAARAEAATVEASRVGEEMVVVVKEAVAMAAEGAVEVVKDEDWTVVVVTAVAVMGMTAFPAGLEEPSAVMGAVEV